MKQNRKKEIPKTTRICDHIDCDEPGICKAPKNRQLREYYWFCTKHAAEYNKNWDFYMGLSPDEIEQHLRNDTSWQRPTWKLGHGGTPRTDKINDRFGVFNEADLGLNGRHMPPPPIEKREKKFSLALDFMDLSWPVTRTDVKRQYKKLAKIYHPDTAKGDTKEAAKLFQKLVDSYTYLMDRL